MKNKIIELSNGCMVSKHMHSKILERANKVATSLDPYIHYKTKDLIGKKKWKRLSLAERCDAEGCMVDMAIQQEVMLDYIGNTRKNFALFKAA